MQEDQSYLGSRAGRVSYRPRPFRLCLVSQQRSKLTRFFPSEFHCNRFTPLPCSGIPSGALLSSRQRLGIFTTSALGWTGSHSAAPSATWLGTSVMVVRGRERRFGMDDEDGSELRAALASSPLLRVGVGGIRQILSPDSFCLGRVVADMASRGSHAVLAPQIVLPHGLSWSAVRRVLGVQLWSPQDKLVPFPLHSASIVWSGITAATWGFSQANQIAFPQCWWPRL